MNLCLCAFAKKSQKKKEETRRGRGRNKGQTLAQSHILSNAKRCFHQNLKGQLYSSKNVAFFPKMLFKFFWRTRNETSAWIPSQTSNFTKQNFFYLFILFFWKPWRPCGSIFSLIVVLHPVAAIPNTEVQIKATLNRGDPTISPEADGIKAAERLLQLTGVVVAQIPQKDWRADKIPQITTASSLLIRFMGRCRMWSGVVYMYIN